MTTTWQHYRAWLHDLCVAPLPTGDPAPQPQEIVIDSRQLERGQWFFALRGERHDGHEHIAAALAQGATGFFADISYRQRLPAALARRGIWIKADSQLQALHALACGYRRSLTNTKIVAITGSVGKTTTRELLRAMLQQSQRVTASPANYNNEIGTALTLFSISAATDIAIVECGARRRGDLALLANIVAPDIVIITNVGSAHVGIFGSPQALLQGKLELLRHSPPHCLGIVNADCAELLAEAGKTGHKLMTFGMQQADVRVAEVTYAGQQQQVQFVSTTRGMFILSSTDLHSAVPINLAAAAAACIALEVDTSDMQAGSLAFCNVPSRFQTITRGKLTIIDDTYNASPESMRCGLETLRRSWPKQRPVLVLGDMIELGADSEAAHRQLAVLVQEVQPVLLVTVGKQARHIAVEASQVQSLSFVDVDAFLQQKINLTQYGNLVYLKASRKIDLTRIVATLN